MIEVSWGSLQNWVLVGCANETLSSDSLDNIHHLQMAEQVYAEMVGWV